MPDKPLDNKEFLSNLSPLPGVYQMLDANDSTLYIGKAKNLKKRLTSYFRKNLASKTAALMAGTAEIKTIITNTETEALLLENNLIKKYKPRYNILLRDDKSYPYIYVSNDKFPLVTFHRGAKNQSGDYFGPYPGAVAVRESLKLIQRIFKIRQCDNSFFNNRSRPCLNYQIKLCSAPCVGYVLKDAYNEDIKHAKMLLAGKSNTVTRKLEKKMQKMAKALQFEAAAKFRDQIKHIRKLQSQQLVTTGAQDVDVLALALKANTAIVQVFVFRGGNNLGNRNYFLQNVANAESSEVLSAFVSQHYLEKLVPDEIILSHKIDNSLWLKNTLKATTGKNIKISHKVRGTRARWLELARKNANIALKSRLNIKASALQRLEALQDALKIDYNLNTIECFDISHSSGEATVGSCVVFRDGIAAKDLYRKYNIKNTKLADDYAAIAEVLHRRYFRALKEESLLPDLIMIDGGKGQLTRAIQVLTELQINSIATISIAKGEGRKPGLETIFTAPQYKKIKFKEQDMALHLLQQIRDEAHRFAISAHRAARAKTRRTSTLQNIKGIGAKRRKNLITYFGGLKEISSAGIDDLVRVPGISRKQAQIIYDSLHS